MTEALAELLSAGRSNFQSRTRARAYPRPPPRMPGRVFLFLPAARNHVFCATSKFRARGTMGAKHYRIFRRYIRLYVPEREKPPQSSRYRWAYIREIER